MLGFAINRKGGHESFTKDASAFMRDSQEQDYAVISFFNMQSVLVLFD